VATSYFVKKQISEYCGREATVIHPILDKNFSLLSSFQTKFKEEQDSEKNFLLFTHGRLESGKGIETIISIFERIKKDDKNIHLTLYGT
jgi:glycosyltransferase involved in cell wall biosynthesis